MAETLKEKVKSKIKKEIELNVEKQELIKLLSEARKVSSEQGICISKEFMYANSGSLVMMKELDWVGDNEVVFHSPDTISKLEKLLRTIPNDEKIKFIIKDNNFIIKSNKRNIKFKMSTKILLTVYNRMVERDTYNNFNSLCVGPYINLSKEKFLEIITIADTINSEIMRFTLNKKKTEIEIKLAKQDSSDEEESSVAYSEGGFVINSTDEEEKITDTLEELETFIFSPKIFFSIPAQNFKFFFNIEGAGILLGEDETRYVVAKRIEQD